LQSRTLQWWHLQFLSVPFGSLVFSPPVQVIARGGSNQLGFSLPSDEADGGAYSRMKSMVMDEMKAYFRPELLNRLDEVVVFKSLEKTEVGAWQPCWPCLVACCSRISLSILHL
jgi:hypothetical protein